MNNIIQELAKFPGREEELIKITRYRIHTVMFYRTNLWTHSRRTFWIIKEIIPYIQKAYAQDCDTKKLQILALIHDDAEILTGDIPAVNKSKMNKAELRQMDEQDKKAIDQLANKFPKHIGTYVYKDLLDEIRQDKTIESQIIMLADKLDAYGESWHEILAGNTCFANEINNEYGTVPFPCQYYFDYLSNFTKKYPATLTLFQHDFWAFHKPQPADFRKLCSLSRPHTPQSLLAITGYEHYDEWKKLLLKNGSQKELKELTTQREFSYSNNHSISATSSYVEYMIHLLRDRDSNPD